MWVLQPSSMPNPGANTAVHRIRADRVPRKPQPSVIMKKLASASLFALTLALACPVFCQTPIEPNPIAVRATQWAKMFNGLKASYSITVVVVSFDHVDEIHNVTAIEASGEFLILRQKGMDGRDYRVVINASNVLLIREGTG